MTTLAQKMEAVESFARAAWHWFLLAGVVLVALALMRECSRADRAEAEAARVQEATELERAGFVVAARAQGAALRSAVSQVPALQAEIDRLTKELGRKPKIVTVERIVTAPAPAEGVPRPAPAPGQPCPDCMFAAGDTGQLVLNRAQAETKNGNEVVIATGECWRLTPEPATRILAGTASAPLSRVSVLIPPAKPGWGAGLGGGISTTGAVGSALVVSPPFLGAHLEGLGILSAGPGLLSAQAAIVWRP